MRGAGMLTVLAVATGCGGSRQLPANVVARVDRYELGVDQLAELMAASKHMPLRKEAAEAVATLWIDYTVFADRLLRGDSLTDSVHVAAAMWPEIRQELADRYHARLVADRVRLDSAQVDSVYAAGDLRLIKHVLFRVEPSAAPAVRDAARREAAHTVERLRDGRLDWSAAAQASDDADSRSQDGSVGVIGRGEKVVAFETAAFALGPGELTGVVESSFGYHILLRPRLAEVRGEFVEGVEWRLEDAFDQAFLAELPARWGIRVREGIAPTIREFGQDPLRAKKSRTLVGTYRGGQLRMADLAQWIQAFPPDARRQLNAASDSQIAEFVVTVMRNEALVREARRAGVQLTPEWYRAKTEELRRTLSQLAAQLGLSADSLAVLRSQAEPQRRDAVTARIVDYLAAVAAGRTPIQAVPPFLADAIRDESRWVISRSAVELALGHARQLRGAGGTDGAVRGTGR